MAYDIVTKDGIRLVNIPDDMAPDDPRLKAMVAEERAGKAKREPAKPKQIPVTTEGVDLGEAGRMAAEGMGPLESARANYGAGVMSAVQGARQILPGLKSPSDQDVRDKRELDRALAKSTETGLGADWLPSAGSALQFAGEVSPSLAIPAGAATGAAGRILPRVVQAAVSTPLRAGITGGAVAGALQPVTADESRTVNTALGGAAGAVVPLGMAGYRLARGLTRGGGEQRAADTLRRTLAARGGPQAADQAVADVGTTLVRGAEDVPLSTAAVTQSPDLALLERASRTRNPAEWQVADQARQNALWDVIQRGTANARNVGDLAAARSQGWQENTARAMGNLKPRNWAREVAALRENLNQASLSPAGQNQMRPVINEISRQMNELGDQFGPEHLAALRARMSGAVRGAPDDPFRSAPTTDPYYQTLKREFDRILNESTGGRWQRVPQQYAEQSVPLSQARASQRLREQFVTPEGTSRVPETDVGSPIVTSARLRQTRSALEGQNRYRNPTFSPETTQALEGAGEALRRADITQRLKSAGTGGGGSNTAMDVLASSAERFHALDPTSATNIVVRTLRGIRDIAGAQERRALDQALMNPDEFVRMMRAHAQAGQLSPLEQRVLQAMSVGSAGAGGALPGALATQEGGR